MSVAFDLILIFLLALCIWKGYQRGLILAIGSIIAIAVAFYAAGYISDTYSSEFDKALKPIALGITDKAFSNMDMESKDENAVYNESVKGLNSAGILKTAASNIAKELSESFTEVTLELKSAMIEKVSSSLSYALVFIISFVLIFILVTIIVNLIDMVFTLPILDLANGISGAALGTVKGIFLICLIAWGCRFVGGITPPELIEDTILLNWFMEHNFIVNLLGL